MRVARKLAQLHGARLVAAHVPSLSASAPTAEEFSADRRRHVEEMLSGVAHELVSRPGAAWPVISAVIQERQANALVLEMGGVSGQGPGGAARHGVASVAEEIFYRAPCAVVTVGSQRGPGRTETGGEFPLERILYATDFSVESLSAAPSAVSLASHARAQLILLYTAASEEENQREAAVQTLRDLVPLGTRLAAKPRCLVERGAFSESTLRVAETENADLLLLGIPRTDPAAPPGTARTVAAAWKAVREAACPVLTVRS